MLQIEAYQSPPELKQMLFLLCEWLKSGARLPRDIVGSLTTENLVVMPL